MEDIMIKFQVQLARLEATLKVGKKDHALGAKKPSMGQQESGE